MEEFLKIYVEVVRPFAETSNPRADDNIFIRVNGMPDDRLGQRFIKFFARDGKRYCTTTARSVQEIRSVDLLASGQITVSFYIFVAVIFFFSTNCFV